MSYQFLHFDSYGMEYSNDSQLSTYLFINNSPIFSPSAFKVDFKLQNPLKYVKRIYLKSFEVPIAFPNIRETSLSNFIDVVVTDEEIKQISIPSGVFEDIGELLEKLNTFSLALHPADDIVFDIDADSGRVKVSSSVHADISVNRTNLSYMLGFSPLIDNKYANNCIAAYVFNLNVDSYLSMYIHNLHSSNSPNVNNKLCTFKIPLNGTSRTVFYSSDNLAFSQYLTIPDPYKIIDKINVIFYDRFGYSINASNADVTFTLLFEFL